MNKNCCPSKSEFNILLAIDTFRDSQGLSTDCTITSLSKRFGVSKTYLSSVVIPLCRKGYVTRRFVGNRRLLRLTSKGEALLAVVNSKEI